MGESCLSSILSPWTHFCAPKNNGLEGEKKGHSHGGHSHGEGGQEDAHVHDGSCDHPELEPEALFERLNKMDLHHDMKICDILDHLATRRARMRAAQLIVAHTVANKSWRDWMAKIGNNIKDSITDSVVDVSDPFSNFNWKLYPKCDFGHAMRNANFFFEEGHRFFSASTFAAVARPVIECRYEWDKFAQKDTTVFRVTQLDTELIRFRHKLADRFSSPSVDKIMLVTSVESAITAVWFSQIWEEGDVILLFEGEDEWTQSAAQLIASRYQVSVVTLNTNLPSKSSAILQKLTQYLESNKRPRFAHIPHVVAASGFIYPVQEMTRILHSHSVPVCINGAVAIGQFPVSLVEISPDYYVGTHHYWLHSLPVSFLYIALESCISPENNSYFFGDSMQREFSYCGLLDFTPWISANIAQGFVKRVCGGLNNQYKHNYTLARRAADILAGKLTSTLYSTISGSWHAMPCVKLPHTEGATQQDANHFMQVLATEHSITVQISRLEVEDDRVLINPKAARNWRDDTSIRETVEEGLAHTTTVRVASLFVLVCVQIYHSESDFQYLAEALLKLCQTYHSRTLGHTPSFEEALQRKQFEPTPPSTPVLQPTGNSASTPSSKNSSDNSNNNSNSNGIVRMHVVNEENKSSNLNGGVGGDNDKNGDEEEDRDSVSSCDEAAPCETGSSPTPTADYSSASSPSSSSSSPPVIESSASASAAVVDASTIITAPIADTPTTTAATTTATTTTTAASDPSSSASAADSSSSSLASSSSSPIVPANAAPAIDSFSFADLPIAATPTATTTTDIATTAASAVTTATATEPVTNTTTTTTSSAASSSSSSSSSSSAPPPPTEQCCPVVGELDSQSLMVMNHAKCGQPLLEGLESVAGTLPWPNWRAVGKPALGKEMKKLFYIDSSGESVFMNCGSFGAAPRPVIEARHALDEFIESKPGIFHQHFLNALVHRACEMLAKELKADPERLVLCDNCNAATSIVMKNQAWAPGDTLFVFDCDYECTLLGAERLWEEFGVVTEKCVLALPLTDDEIVAAVNAKLTELKEKGVTPRLANFCHITSRTAYTFPAKRLVDLFHSYGIPVAVDGAHAAGQLDLDLRDIGADYYMGTMHKWMYTIQGVAFLYVKDTCQALSPLVSPKVRGQGLTREFCASSIPQRDLTNWISAIWAMEFVEHCCGGWDAVRKYTHRMAEEAQQVLCKDLNTDVFQSADCYRNMPLVRLPATAGASLASAKLLMTKLLQHGITAFVIRLTKNGSQPFLYVRLSMQIYHDHEDVARLSKRLKELSGQGVFAGFGFASHAVASLVSRPIRQLSSANGSSVTRENSFISSSNHNNNFPQSGEKEGEAKQGTTKEEDEEEEQQQQPQEIPASPDVSSSLP